MSYGEREMTRDTLAGYVAGLAGRDLRDNVSYGQCYPPCYILGYEQGTEHRLAVLLADKPVTRAALIAASRKGRGARS